MNLKRRILPFAFLTWLVIAGCQNAENQRESIERSETSTAELKFDPETVVGEPFPAISDAPFFTADEADEHVEPTDLVLGVFVGETARAYPIAALEHPTREIVNDFVGGIPLAATW